MNQNIQAHLEAEGGDRGNLNWKSGGEIHPDWKNLEDCLESNIERITDASYFEREFPPSKFEFSFSHSNRRKRSKYLGFLDDVYDCFEQIYDIEISESERELLKEDNIYDEGWLFNIGHLLGTTAAAGTLATGLTATGGYLLKEHIETLSREYIETQTAATAEIANTGAMNNEILLASSIIGLAAGSIASIYNYFTMWGKYMENSWETRLHSLRGSRRTIGISPTKMPPRFPTKVGIHENFHAIQYLKDSPTTKDPLLSEGMAELSNYLVMEKMAELRKQEDRELSVLNNYEKEIEMYFDACLMNAYATIKNNNGIKDIRTFIDVGLDPEESLEAINSVRTPARNPKGKFDFGYDVAAATLIYEYEEGRIDPSEVFHEGKDGVSTQVEKLYDLPMMESAELPGSSHSKAFNILR